MCVCVCVCVCVFVTLAYCAFNAAPSPALLAIVVRSIREFTIAEHSVQFSVKFSASDYEGGEMGWDAIEGWDDMVHRSEDGKKKGCYTPECDGDLHLTWDNATSMMMKKNVSFQVTLLSDAAMQQTEAGGNGGGVGNFLTDEQEAEQERKSGSRGGRKRFGTGKLGLKMGGKLGSGMRRASVVAGSSISGGMSGVADATGGKLGDMRSSVGDAAGTHLGKGLAGKFGRPKFKSGKSTSGWSVGTDVKALVPVVLSTELEGGDLAGTVEVGELCRVLDSGEPFFSSCSFLGLSVLRQSRLFSSLTTTATFRRFDY